MGLSNNDIFKKLRVANQLTNDDIVEICMLVGYKVSKSELGAIFRREGHPKYMECGDQLLRNFLDGLIVLKRGPMDKSKSKKKPQKSTFKNKKDAGKPSNKINRDSGKSKSYGKRDSNPSFNGKSKETKRPRFERKSDK